MLEDFDPKKPIDSAQKPRGVIALAISVAGLGGLFTVLVALSQQPSAPVEEPETEVTFEDAPPAPEQPEEEQPEPEQQVNDDPRPAAAREELVAPVEIPDEPLAESDAELAEPLTPSGPVEGIVGGGGGTGTGVRQALGPPPEEEDDDDEHAAGGEHFSIEDAVAPRLLDGCRAPSFPNDPSLVGQVVRVRCTISVDGTPTCTVTSGPDAARGPALECAQDRRYEPARYPDGTATAYPKPLTFIIGGS